MKAILEYIKLEKITYLSVENQTFTIRTVYDSIQDYRDDKISKVFINYDGELLDDIILSLVDDSYSGEYAIFHIFKTDKLYLSDITRHVVELLKKEVNHED